MRSLPRSLARYIARSASRSSVVGGLASRSADRDPDARGHEQLAARGAMNAARARRGCARRRAPARARRRSASTQDDELVAAEAGDECRRPAADEMRGRGLHEQLVADRVAEAVVDDLEPVEIDEEHADARARRRARRRARTRAPRAGARGSARPVSVSWSPAGGARPPSPWSTTRRARSRRTSGGCRPGPRADQSSSGTPRPSVVCSSSSYGAAEDHRLPRLEVAGESLAWLGRCAGGIRISSGRPMISRSVQPVDLGGGGVEATGSRRWRRR